jgi:hypothetical protein
MVTFYLQYMRAATRRALARLARTLAIALLGPVDVIKGPGGAEFIVDRSRGRLMPVFAGGADDDDDDDDAKEDDEKDKAKDDKADDDDDAAADKPDDDDDAAKVDWKRQSRKHERDKKKAQIERDDLARKLREREDADKTEQQKAIDTAREEGRTTALSEATKERRADRLENASLRLANKGVTVGEGDDAQKVKFADPEDAEAHLQRAIRRGDVDEDELFDDKHKVNEEALADAFAEILDAKPHLRAGAAKSDDDEDDKGKERRTAKGGGDAGKGDRGEGKGLEEMSPADHYKDIQKR